MQVTSSFNYNGNRINQFKYQISSLRKFNFVDLLTFLYMYFFFQFVSYFVHNCNICVKQKNLSYAKISFFSLIFFIEKKTISCTHLHLPIQSSKKSSISIRRYVSFHFFLFCKFLKKNTHFRLPSFSNKFQIPGSYKEYISFIFFLRFLISFFFIFKFKKKIYSPHLPFLIHSI